MKSDLEDARLREAMVSLRQTNERMTPAFSAIWSGAQRRVLAKAPARWGYRAAAVACVALAVIAVTVQLRQSRPFEPSQQSPQATSNGDPMATAPAFTVLHWRSPTEFLLTSPNRELLRGVPHFGLPAERRSILDPKQET